MQYSETSREDDPLQFKYFQTRNEFFLGYEFFIQRNERVISFPAQLQQIEIETIIHGSNELRSMGKV